MRILGLAIVLLATLAAPESHAAPLCLQAANIPLQCIYVDAAQCQRESHRLGGQCALNPSQPLTPIGDAPFCIVESGTALTCQYHDRPSCTAESRRRNGACVAAVPQPFPTQDPYEDRRPY
jgi:hypothetical protein